MVGRREPLSLGRQVKHGPFGAAGQEFGLHLIGFRSQPVQHIEAGIATNGLDYLPAALTWNAADVAGVLTSLLGSGELPDQMDSPG